MNTVNGSRLLAHEVEALRRVAEKLRTSLGAAVTEIWAFGSRVRKDHGAWSDFDLLVILVRPDLELQRKVVDILVEEELISGLPFAPVIKSQAAFDSERRYHTPFFQNINREGISL